MTRSRLFGIMGVCALLLVAASAEAGGNSTKRTRAARPQSGAEKIVSKKPVDAWSQREDKPRNGWDGFYGGLNSGGATDTR